MFQHGSVLPLPTEVGLNWNMLKSFEININTPLWTSYKFSLELISCCFWCCRCAEVLRFGKGFFRQRTYELVDEKQCFWLNQILHAVTEKRSVSSGPNFMGGLRVVSQPMPWHPTIMCWKEIWWSWWMLLQCFLPYYHILSNVCSNPKNNYRQLIITYPNFIQFPEGLNNPQWIQWYPMGCSFIGSTALDGVKTPVEVSLCRGTCYVPSCMLQTGNMWQLHRSWWLHWIGASIRIAVEYFWISLTSSSLHPPYFASLAAHLRHVQVFQTHAHAHARAKSCQIECTQVLMCTVGWLNGCFLGALVSIHMGPMFAPPSFVTRTGHMTVSCAQSIPSYSIMQSCNSRPICHLGQQSGSG